MAQPMKQSQTYSSQPPTLSESPHLPKETEPLRGRVEQRPARDASDEPESSAERQESPPSSGTDTRHASLRTQDRVVEASGDDDPSTANRAPSLPFSYASLLSHMKGNPTFSLTWLAWWCLRKLKRAHIVIKRIHGHVVGRAS